MEDLRSALLREPRRSVEIDEFFEEIEAPKFVDFTVPDRSRPDDSSWFCVRIGCDQQHEQVDPDALHRSFRLRAMAARSPNLRLRKALNQDVARGSPLYAQSAPAKPVKDRITRLITIPSNTRLKDHPISSLRTTPKCANAKVQSITRERALTTPRNKKCPSNQELFRSVRHQKVPVAVPKNQSTAKALVFGTPKKTAAKSAATSSITPISEACAQMKQLKIGSVKKTVPRERPNCPILGSNKGVESAKSLKKTVPRGRPNCPILGSNKGVESAKSLKKNSKFEKNCHQSSNAVIGGKLSSVSISTANVEEQLASSVGSNSIGSVLSFNSNLQTSSEESVGFASCRSTETVIVKNAKEADDNKENISENYTSRDINSNTTCSESESLQFENCKNLNLHPKAIKAPRKTFEANLGQGGKHKRTTNPKPFRLRTDERGSLREANLERKLHLEAQKETASALRCRDGVSDNKIGKRVQTSQPNEARTANAKLVRFAGAKLVTSSPRCHEQENRKENLGEKSRKGILKVVSSRHLIKSPSVMAARNAHSSLSHRNNSNTSNAMCSQGKKPTTIAKEPSFHKIHVPKGCIKRS